MPKMVLIVDDVPFVRYPMTLALVRAGYAVDEAGDGETALATVQRRPVDCLVTDLTLPKKSGLELAVDVRSELIGKDIPIVLLVDRPSPTVVSYVDAARASWGAGVTVMEKPRTPGALAELVATVRTLAG